MAYNDDDDRRAWDDAADYARREEQHAMDDAQRRNSFYGPQRRIHPRKVGEPASNQAGTTPKTSKWRGWLQRLIASANERDNEQRSGYWIYRAYYNANQKNGRIMRHLKRLNHGTVTGYDARGSYEDTEQDLSGVVATYEKRTHLWHRLAVVSVGAGFIPVIIPPFHPSLLNLLIAAGLWTALIGLMCVTTADNVFASKLMSRARVIRRHGKKVIVSDDEKVTNQREQITHMFWTLALLAAAAMQVAINFGLYPLLRFAAHPGHGVTWGMFYLSPSFIGAFTGRFLMPVHTLLLAAPIMLMYTTYKTIENNITRFHKNVDVALNEERYRLKPLHELLGGHVPSYEPVLVMGQSLITGDDVTINVQDRANGMLVTGTNGAGKSGSIFKPAISQDLIHYVMFLRAYPQLRELPNYYSKNVAARYLGGIVAMDTTNDLCRDAYELARKDLNIPADMIRWLDPGNPDSQSINLMRGPAQAVTNMLVSCIGGLMDNGNGKANPFFDSSGKSWFQNYVLLVKMAGVMKPFPVSFDELFDTCLDTAKTDDYLKLLTVYEEILRKLQALYYLYARKHVDLQIPVDQAIETDIATYEQSGSPAFKAALKRAQEPTDVEFHTRVKQVYDAYEQADIDPTKRFIAQEQFISNLINATDQLSSGPVSYNLVIPFNEIRTAYMNVHDIHLWFQSNVARYKDEPKVNDKGKLVQSRDQRNIENAEKQGLTPHRRGKYVYFDRQESYVKQIRVALNTMSENAYVRRIFFNRKVNDNFSIDNFFHTGGILLMYTGKSTPGVSVENSRMIAKIEQALIFSAAQRRMVDDGAAAEPLMPIYFDEHVDYMTAEYVQTTGQVRKYGTPLMSIVQSPAQITNKFGDAFTKTLMATLRTKVAFGDAEANDAKYSSAMFGTHQEFKKAYSDTKVQGPRNDRFSLRGNFQQVPNITPEELMRMQEYTIAIRYNDKNSPVPYDHLKVTQVDHQQLHHSPYRMNPEEDVRDQAAIQAYREDINRSNPDFAGVDLIMHEYFMRVRSYFEHDHQDLYQTDNLDYNHAVEPLTQNLKAAMDYVQELGRTTNSLPHFDQIEPIHQTVMGVPEWVFEELRDNLFEAPEDEDADDASPVTTESQEAMQPQVKSHETDHGGKRADSASEDELAEQLQRAPIADDEDEPANISDIFADDDEIVYAADEDEDD